MEKGVIDMKKFLISFIIGVVMMAIGTTSLIFEIGQFDHVRAEEILSNNKLGYRSEVFNVKENEMIDIRMEDSYGDYSYEYVYDESMKDRVKISFSDAVSYSRSDLQVVVNDIDGYNGDFFTGWDHFKYFLEGLKERKIYELQGGNIIITTSYANKERVRISSYDY